MTSAELHVLSSHSHDLGVILPSIISFSNAIFSADPTTKYASETYWIERLSHPSSVIVYLTPTGAGTDIGESITPIGFVFAHPRAHSPPLESGPAETLHIWLAGVSPDYRKAGCLQRMIGAISGGGFSALTVCTTPERFPDMWGWLQKRGWRVEHEMGEGKLLLSKPVAV